MSWCLGFANGLRLLIRSTANPLLIEHFGLINLLKELLLADRSIFDSEYPVGASVIFKPHRFIQSYLGTLQLWSTMHLFLWETFLVLRECLLRWIFSFLKFCLINILTIIIVILRHLWRYFFNFHSICHVLYRLFVQIDGQNLFFLLRAISFFQTVIRARWRSEILLLDRGLI